MALEKSPYWVQSEDWHTAGEPFRIVDQLPPHTLPEGETVAQRRSTVISTPEHPLDELRKLLCYEPRGHPDMYGGFIVPPDDSGAHFGVLFWHKDGFSTACGHGTIALGYWAISKGIVKIPDNDGSVDVVIDVPSGRVTARLTIQQGKPIHADFINVLSYPLARGVTVRVPSLGGMSVYIDIAFAGAVYATLDAAQLGLKVEPSQHSDFIRLGREIKAELGNRATYSTYDLYGVIFFNEEGEDEGDTHAIKQRSVTVFADGQIDRSPCGSGSCARLALLLAQGRLGASRSKLIHRSIIGTTFEADILEEKSSPKDDGTPACIPCVRGHAGLVGRMNFYIDPADPVYPGFLLR
ncbi:hypothetical protein NPX13_g5414 [Xylaria arbuscula]|uniref:trans-L-3-hydroxyproline dehydratase n=1 Tax=Xylaria arbuscula TaxID=114810 RepID=A0A9W8NEV7_9PEZI|nr:hypothetical protein NPX13_g5414 [Xylaria arbuscula]